MAFKPIGRTNLQPAGKNANNSQSMRAKQVHFLDYLKISLLFKTTRKDLVANLECRPRDRTNRRWAGKHATN